VETPVPRESCGSAGLTLIELLAVLAILSLLAALSLSSVSRFRSQSEVQNARIEMARIAAAVTECEATYGCYPVSREASRAADLFDEERDNVLSWYH
jgi:prepilin-type N-terminal cleavage/methylation domain-containing protein